MKRGPKLFLTLLGIFAIIIIAMVLIVQIFQIVIIKKVYDYVVQNFINVTGMSSWIAKGLIILLLIPFVWAIFEATRLMPRIRMPLSRKKVRSYRKLGILVIVSYIALFFISMFFLSRGTYFGHMKGEAMKYYAVTPEGIRFFDSPGFDPKYGIELKSVTPKMIDQYERAKRGMQPKRVDTSKEIEFFDSITGEPKIWYYKDSEGNYEFFNQPGFHPVYWEELKPISRELVVGYKKRVKQMEEEGILREEERRRQEKLAMKKAYIERHINPVISNNPLRVEIAVLVADKKTLELSPSSRTTGDKIREKLTKKNIKAVSNLFKNEFFIEGNFNNLYQGDIHDISDLELKNHVDYLILGKKECSFSQDPRLGDLISCTLHLDLKIFTIKTGEIISSNSFKEAGVGIDKKKAEQQAVDRIVSKVENFVLSKIKK